MFIRKVDNKSVYAHFFVKIRTLVVNNELAKIANTGNFPSFFNEVMQTKVSLCQQDDLSIFSEETELN